MMGTYLFSLSCQALTQYRIKRINPISKLLPFLRDVQTIAARKMTQVMSKRAYITSFKPLPSLLRRSFV